VRWPSPTSLLGAAAALALLASLVAVGRLLPPLPAGPAARPVAAPSVSVVKLDVGGPVQDLARTIQPVAGGIVEHLWIAGDGQVLRVDPDAMQMTTVVAGYRPRADRPVRLAVTQAGALVATVAGDRLLVINPGTARVIATDPIATRAPVAATIDREVVAVCCDSTTRPGGGRLLRLGWGPGPRWTVALAGPGRPDAVGTGPSGVWVRGAGGGVWHLDQHSLGVVATVAVPGGLGATPGQRGRHQRRSLGRRPGPRDPVAHRPWPRPAGRQGGGRRLGPCRGQRPDGVGQQR
jgi:hypothetical protein